MPTNTQRAVQSFVSFTAGLYVGQHVDFTAKYILISLISYMILGFGLDYLSKIMKVYKIKIGKQDEI